MTTDLGESAPAASPAWLLEQMTGAASPAKAAVGDTPVLAHIASWMTQITAVPRLGGAKR